MVESPTLNRLFEDFRRKNLQTSWRKYHQELWDNEIDFYFDNGFHIIPIAENSKVPTRGFKWNIAGRLGRQEASQIVSEGNNLAVVAGLSSPELVILDIDEEIPLELEGALKQTLTMRSPRGYAFFTYGPYEDRLFQKMRSKYPAFDLPREGIMYQLLPLSKTCIADHTSKHECKRHDYRVRQWVDRSVKILPFQEFVRQFG